MDDKISITDIKEIIDLVRAENKIEWFVFKQGDTEIAISRNGIPILRGAAAVSPAAPSAPAAPVDAPVAEAAPAAPAPKAAAVGADYMLATGDVAVKSPMVGTFYSSPKPGADPFVEVGKEVRQGETLCIIEVMKLMNSVKAEITGKIKKVLVKDGEPVEFGQTLIIIGAHE